MGSETAISFPPAGLDRHMPMPPVATSDTVFPGWNKLRFSLYRLPPARIMLPAGQTLRIVVQLSSRSTRLEREIRGVRAIAQPGLDAINFNPANQAINWQWDNFLEFVQLQIDPAFLTQMQDQHGIVAERILALDRFNMHDPLIAQLGHEIADILEARHPKVETAYLDSLATFLVLHLWNRHCRVDVEHTEPAGVRGPDFHRIVAFIHGNLDKDLRIEQIARMANLSSFYFIRLFKAVVGKTPHQYILDCRIGLAKDLLLGSFLPISEIAQRCGFSTQSHFTSAFRQATDESPRAFRQSHGKAAVKAH
ncbi:MAG TPA: AraC family transcriptional regulator [Gammaproteobacteria bacterium]